MFVWKNINHKKTKLKMTLQYDSCHSFHTRYSGYADVTCCSFRIYESISATKAEFFKPLD
jgi:hypothetical protein